MSEGHMYQESWQQESQSNTDQGQLEPNQSWERQVPAGIRL